MLTSPQRTRSSFKPGFQADLVKRLPQMEIMTFSAFDTTIKPPPVSFKSLAPMELHTQATNNSCQGAKARKRATVGPGITQILPLIITRIGVSSKGVLLQWDKETCTPSESMVASYHILVCEVNDLNISPPSDASSWNLISVVEAMPLPMACSVDLLRLGTFYYFAVLPVSVFGHKGELSHPTLLRLDI